MFDSNNIGKLILYKTTNVNLFTEVPDFCFIIGYDYLNDTYLCSDMKEKYEHIGRVSTDAKIYSLEDALVYVDDMIELAKIRRAVLVKPYTEVALLSKHISQPNYQNEIKHLANAYYESKKQIDILESYADTNNESYKKLYEHELAATRKAVRRLDKRFNYFFGIYAGLLKKCIMSMVPQNSLGKGIDALERSEVNLMAIKKRLTSNGEKFSKNT